MSFENFDSLKVRPGSGKRILKSKLLLALGGKPFPGNTERILERKISLLAGSGGGGPVVPPPDQGGLLVGLGSYWRLDEVGTNFNPRVDSMNGYNFIPQNVGAASLTGLLNLGYSGTLTSWMNAPDVPFRAGPGASFSFSMWMKGDPSIWQDWSEGNGTFIGKMTFVGAFGYHLHFNSALGGVLWSCVEMTTNVHKDIIVTSGIGLGTTTWHHYAFGYDATLDQMWSQFDNGTRKTQACGDVQPGTGLPLTLNALSDGSSPSQQVSSYDEIGYWFRSLSVLEVSTLYNGGTGWPFTSFTNPFVGSVAYWNLNETGPGTRVDSTGNGNDLSDIGLLMGSIAGKIGLAANSTGGGGGRILSHVDNVYLRAGTGVSWSVSIWGTCNSPASPGSLVGKSDNYNVNSGEWRIVNVTSPFGHWEVNVWDTASNLTTFDLRTTYANQTLFNHIVLTFDDATKRLAVYVNGVFFQAATLLNSVKATAYPFNILNENNSFQNIGGAADECAFWSRALTQTDVTMLYNGGAGLAFVGTGLSLSQQWSNRVVGNGGVAPAVATVNAVDVFINGCISDGIWNDLISVNAIVPDSLIAAMTPIKGTLWVNHNFLSGDLTVNGLIGNGTSKYMDTGVVAANSPSLLTTSAGLVAYVTDNSAVTTVNDWCMGVNDTAPGNSAFSIALVDNAGANTTVNCWAFTGATNFLDVAKLTTPRFLSMQRTSASQLDLYHATSAIPHAVLGTITGAQTISKSAGTGAIYAMALNNVGSPFAFTKCRMSFFAITGGLTAAKSALLYARVQALRTALGGGFV